eukprot:CAMPEP_0195518640 /NCGR_PEP_ID=MMETSP0794_2-20130614/13389_1 /TAXON_ID=515487 /ORGANISM="Stephanopyxis turris, Strain CCMP 815" /LENGTH=239 /DNA_ID=CAMNT_0040647653 /DNA_START=301 /DNA_END=1017 /DNA_ORIENTATION=+
MAPSGGWKRGGGADRSAATQRTSEGSAKAPHSALREALVASSAPALEALQLRAHICGHVAVRERDNRERFAIGFVAHLGVFHVRSANETRELMHPPVPDRNEHGAFGRVQHVLRRIDERQRAEVVHMQRHIQAPELLRNRKPLAFGHVRGANVAHPIAQFVRAQLVTEHVEVRQVMVGCARGERARDQARAGHDPAVRGREDGDPHRALVVAVHEEAVVVVERELRVRVRVWRPLQFVV